MTNAGQRQFFFSVHISQQEFLKYYQGAAEFALVTSECGRRLRFPALRLRPFLSHHGINGRFVLTVDKDNRFLSLQQVHPRR
ncbi:MAG: DUF2835 domain-containing protein [Desulfuromonadales bacterium]|nr:DUF2835 domain-containing protein [Desulfuromonadales bacterium]